MAKTIGSYKGLWQKVRAAQESATLVPELSPQLVSVDRVEGRPAEDAVPRVHDETRPPISAGVHPESAELLTHHYQMIVLREHRFKLGRDLLETDQGRPLDLAVESLKTLGSSFRPWAHGRIFALGCYLGIEMSPDILQQLRHPLWMGRYRRSMVGLWRLLEIMAQKTGQKPISGFAFRLFYLIPPCGVFIFERKLQTLVRAAQGRHPSPGNAWVKATQGQ